MLDELLSRCDFGDPGPVRCGLSGGADSTALVVLAVAAGLDVTAVHVDHGLRPDSAAEIPRVAELADAAGARFESRRVTVAPGANLEERAREARLAVLGPDALLGHTLDDRAETLFVNLLRGAGAAGLSAMGPGPTRPLLALRRAETRALCRHLGLRAIEDPSNADPRFVRNRIRHEVLPLLDDIADRDVVELLARSADVLTADARALDEAAAGVVTNDARVLAALPTDLATAAVRRWLLANGLRPDRAGVHRVLAVARGEDRACELAGGRRVERHRQRLHILDRDQVS